MLNSFCDSKHSNGSSQPLCVHRIKVFFKNEPGEGSGVTRSLFTALSEALLSDEPLPKLDPVLKAKRPLSRECHLFSCFGWVCIGSLNRSHVLMSPQPVEGSAQEKSRNHPSRLNFW